MFLAHLGLALRIRAACGQRLHKWWAINVYTGTESRDTSRTEGKTWKRRGAFKILKRFFSRLVFANMFFSSKNLKGLGWEASQFRLKQSLASKCVDLNWTDSQLLPHFQSTTALCIFPGKDEDAIPCLCLWFLQGVRRKSIERSLDLADRS